MLLLGALLTGACRSEPPGESLAIVVPAGSTLEAIADTLAVNGVIEPGSERRFRLYARLKGADRDLKAGHYELRVREPWRTIVETLEAGRVTTVPLTIPEGFTLKQMAPRIAEIAGLEADAVEVRLSGAEAAAWNVPGPGLEGYLFPDTYRFEPGSSLDRVIEVMTERHGAFWTPERRARLDSIGMTVREAVTLASIVQAEARLVEEMPRIASVYHNRLEQGHALQADPTVLYALGGWRERLLYAAIDSVADHPYNTYAHVGLPPGPIGAPGEAALEAVLHPEETDYFYFVARPDGSHVFTRSLAAHNRAKAAARRERRSGPGNRGQA